MSRRPPEERRRLTRDDSSSSPHRDMPGGRARTWLRRRADGSRCVRKFAASSDRHATRNGSMCFPSSTGSSPRPAAPSLRGGTAAKMAAIVGRIQLAAKPHVPAVCRVEPRNAVHDTLEDAQVGLGAQLGYGERVSTGRFDETRASARSDATAGRSPPSGIVSSSAGSSMPKRQAMWRVASPTVDVQIRKRTLREWERSRAGCRSR